MSGQARLGREFVSYEPDEENKLTDLLQAASALRARWNESSALQISSSSSAAGAGAGADRGAHGAARSVSPSTGQVRVTKEILDQKRRELLNLKKRASEPTASLSNASPSSFYTSGSPPLSTPPSRSSPVPGSGSPPPSLTPAGKPKSPPHVLPLVPPTGHLRGEEQLRRALADMEARLLMAKSEVLKEREAGTSARARLKVEWEGKWKSAERAWLETHAALQLRLKESEKRNRNLEGQVAHEKKAGMIHEAELEELVRLRERTRMLEGPAGKDMSMTIAALEERLARANEDMRNEQDEHRATKKRVKELQAEAENAEEEVTRLKIVAMAAEEDLKRIRNAGPGEALLRSQEEITSLQGRSDMAVQAEKRLASQLKIVKDENVRLSMELDKAVSDLVDERRLRMQAEDDAKRRREELVANSTKISGLEDMLQAVEKEAEASQSQKMNHIDELEILQSNLSEAQAEAESLREKAAARDDAEARVAELNEELNRMALALESLRERQRVRGEEEVVGGSFASRQRELEEKVLALTKEADGLRKASEKAKRDAMDAVQKELSQARQEAESGKAEVKALRQHQARLKTRHDEMAATMSDMRSLLKLQAERALTSEQQLASREASWRESSAKAQEELSALRLRLLEAEGKFTEHKFSKNDADGGMREAADARRSLAVQGEELAKVRGAYEDAIQRERTAGARLEAARARERLLEARASEIEKVRAERDAAETEARQLRDKVGELSASLATQRLEGDRAREAESGLLKARDELSELSMVRMELGVAKQQVAEMANLLTSRGKREQAERVALEEELQHWRSAAERAEVTREETEKLRAKAGQSAVLQQQLELLKKTSAGGITPMERDAMLSEAAERVELEEEVAILKRQVEDLSSEAKHWKQQAYMAASLREEVEMLRGSVEEAERMRGEVARWKSVAESRAALDAEVARWRREAARLEVEMREHDEALTHAVSRGRDKERSLIDSLEAAEARARRAESNSDSMQAEMKRLVERMEQGGGGSGGGFDESRYIRLEEEYRTYREHMSIHLEELRQRGIVHTGATSGVEEALKEALRQRSDALMAADEHAAKLREVRGDVEERDEALRQAKSVIDEAQVQVRSLQRHAKGLEESKAESDEALKRLRERYEQMHTSSLEDAREMHDETESLRRRVHAQSIKISTLEREASQAWTAAGASGGQQRALDMAKAEALRLSGELAWQTEENERLRSMLVQRDAFINTLERRIGTSPSSPSDMGGSPGIRRARTLNMEESHTRRPPAPSLLAPATSMPMHAAPPPAPPSSIGSPRGSDVFGLVSEGGNMSPRSSAHGATPYGTPLGGNTPHRGPQGSPQTPASAVMRSPYNAGGAAGNGAVATYAPEVRPTFPTLQHHTELSNAKPTYYGELEDGWPHGRGITVWADGRVYDGHWNKGVFSGLGTCVWYSGDTYEGEWHDGFAHGMGRYTYVSGDVYEGTMKQDRFHGHGSMTHTSGWKYKGGWEEGLMQGWGLVVLASGEKVRQFFNKGVPLAGHEASDELFSQMLMAVSDVVSAIRQQTKVVRESRARTRGVLSANGHGSDKLLATSSSSVVMSPPMYSNSSAMRESGSGPTTPGIYPSKAGQHPHMGYPSPGGSSYPSPGSSVPGFSSPMQHQRGPSFQSPGGPPGYVPHPGGGEGLPKSGFSSPGGPPGYTRLGAGGMPSPAGPPGYTKYRGGGGGVATSPAAPRSDEPPRNWSPSNNSGFF